MNSFGRIFKISLFGESHGNAVGVVMDGIPAGIPFSASDLLPDLKRRKGGLPGTTPRVEEDQPEIHSGIFNGHTNGAPLAVIFRNQNTRPADYEYLSEIPRPGHADFTAGIKYSGFADLRGGGHFSGRITLALVVAGALAKRILDTVKINASILEIGGNTNLEAAINDISGTMDSIGGIVECRATDIPAGWGEPFFDSIESVISHLAFSIPAIKGIEFGSGFGSARMKGSEHNDPFENTDGKTVTNHAGGINGGISNGNELVFRVAVKPTSSIGKIQQTVHLKSGNIEPLSIKGRHDACVALRIPVILEAVTAIALADFKLIRRSQA